MEILMIRPEVGFPLNNRLCVKEVDVWITRILVTGNTIHCREELAANPPKLFICGHSILKVMFDKDDIHIRACGKVVFIKLLAYNASLYE
jgi:hypothetical protein